MEIEISSSEFEVQPQLNEGKEREAAKISSSEFEVQPQQVLKRFQQQPPD